MRESLTLTSISNIARFRILATKVFFCIRLPAHLAREEEKVALEQALFDGQVALATCVSLGDSGLGV